MNSICQTMKPLALIASLIAYSAFSQPTPKILDTLAPTYVFSPNFMVQGGYDIIGTSNNLTTFSPAKNEYYSIKTDSLSAPSAEEILVFAEEIDSIVIQLNIEITPNEVPPPPPPVVDDRKQFEMGSGLMIYVDTTQNISIPAYKDNSINGLNDGSTFREMYNAQIDFLDKYYNQSDKLMEGYPVIIFNSTDTTWRINTIEGWVYMIQEALDKNGTWKPIEYIDYRAVCGNSYWSENLHPQHYLVSKVYRYSGDFKTKLRVRFVTQKKIFISNEFKGSINLSQFDIPSFLPFFTEKINDHFLSN